ncbi:hypothetical protein AO239_18160 [Pseudomonas sp. ICMP 19500]|uniref:dermonecrotic toxin domain-containing protein n=1 Tax=Pseudomonas TaxID=286 RepID=UPI000730EE31|nr:MULTISPECIES: DUF6543 domain-containing protein [Pseudomonas]KTC29903.1 hypothetical protein AO239_18160 [Pseudomonas sp. ICMP 19500]
MTLPPDQLGVTAPSSDPDETLEEDAPPFFVDADLQALRTPLRERINAYPHPSRLINQIGLADARCRESTRALTRLIGRSPRILKVIRAQLQKAFEIDPDSLLFTEPMPPRLPQKVDTLTDRALLLLVRPSVPFNINQYTLLSVKGAPDRRLPYTPLEALRRVIALGLFERLGRAANQYWDALEYGSWLTRRERWIELHQALFADRAFIARQLNELSRAGLAMVQAVIDAPTAEARLRAGGQWADVRVGPLMWPGNPAVAIAGALHFYREGDPDDVPHVVYLPGVARNFYEYPSFVALACGVQALGRTRLHELWQCLPLSRRSVLLPPATFSSVSTVSRGVELMEDALASSAQALLEGQWANELACTVKSNHAHVFAAGTSQPLESAVVLARVERNRQQLIGGARLGPLREQLLKWDQQRRHAEIIFGSTAPGLAEYTVEHRIKRYEKGLVALLDPDDLSNDTPAYQAFVSLVSQLNAHAQTMDRWVQDAQQRLFEVAFWAERPGGKGTLRRGTLFLDAQTEALRCEVQLQHRLKLISTAHRDLIIEVLDQPLPSKRPDSQTRVLSIAIGNDPDAFYPLHNMWVVTTAAAVRVPRRQHAVVLCGFGAEGGVQGFSGLDALTRSIKASLDSWDRSALWDYVEHDKRNDLRSHAARGTLAVRYVPINGKPALAAIKTLLGCYQRLHNSTEDITRIFNGVKDAQISRALLLAELQEQLKAPVSDAQSRAQANVELLRKTALQAKKLPAWLEHASRYQRKKFRRSQRFYLSSTFAFKTRLEDQLPGLEAFARRALIDRLRLDGIPAQFDIDQPFIDMPDDVQGSYCGWTSGCAIGDRAIKLTPTLKRTTYSLLQLAQHNLDPLAPWTQWRLNRARYLQPEWKNQLNAAYLIRTISSLDVGGQYDVLINQVFYPPGDTLHTLSKGRIPELLNRTLLAGTEQHLLLATQQGLTATAQSIFTTAMAARTPQDLLKNQHELQLHVLHLVGHTMQHDRYIAGLVIVRDLRSGHCVIYWPNASPALVLTEYCSLQQAQDALNRLGARPENTQMLARQIAPGWAFQAITHHPVRVDRLGAAVSYLDAIPAFAMVKGIWQAVEFVRSFGIKHLEPTVLPDEVEQVILEQIASEPEAWLAIVPTSHSDAQALLYDAPVLELKRQTQAASHSGKALDEYRTRRLGEQGETRTRRLIAFFSPLFGMFNDAYELLLVARRFHRYGDPHDAVDVGFMSAFMAADLLTNFIPGPKGRGSAVAKVTRPAPRALLARIHRMRMAVRDSLARVKVPVVTQLKVFDRFKIKAIADDAVALKGPGKKGIHVKKGELFLTDDTHHYPIYQRENEQVFRLKNTRQPGEDELILHIDQPGERLLGSGDPQPGPSSGVLNPWRVEVEALRDWFPPTVRSATQSTIVQSSTVATHWFDWRIRAQAIELSDSSIPGVLRVQSTPQGAFYNAIYIGARYDTPSAGSGIGYYRLLDTGDQAPLTDIAFITRDTQQVSLARTDIERWTSTAINDQPIPVSRTSAGEWQLHAPLFDRPLERYVGSAFPTLTNTSQALAVARLIELSGPPQLATASHLLNIRATLDKWLLAVNGRVGQTDDLLQMLRPNERRKEMVYIGYDGKAPGFTRVDFTPPHPLDLHLQFGVTPVRTQRLEAERSAVRAVLEQQGFAVQDLSLRRQGTTAGEFSHESVVTHRHSNKIYYVAYQWLETGRMTLRTKLTDKWIRFAIKLHPDSLLLKAVDSALQEQRLVRIVAGIQWATKGNLNPSVYFVKLAP